MDDSQLSNLNREVNDIKSLQTTIYPVMPRLVKYLIERRDHFLSQLVDKNDEVLRGRIQEIQSMIDIQKTLEAPIQYRIRLIESAGERTTSHFGLDSLTGDFMQ